MNARPTRPGIGITRRHFIALGLGCFAFRHASGHDAHHPHDPDPEEIALGSLADAELALAVMAVERGWRAALRANAAPEGVLIERNLVPLDKLETQPAIAGARYQSQPAQIGVSLSRDFGYTTGPYAVRDASHPGAPEHGIFLRVWSRADPDPWRILVTATVTTPVPVDFMPWGPAPRPSFTGSANPVRERVALQGMEANLAPTRSARRNVRVHSLIAPDERVYRDNAMPLAGADAVRRPASETSCGTAPSSVRVSRSADLAVAYGPLRVSGEDRAMPNGHYIHVWLRDHTARWRLAYDMVPGQDATTGE